MQLYTEDPDSTLPKTYSEVKDSGQRQSFDTGAVRDIQTGKGRFDLVLSLPHMLTRLARHFENGARKYGDDNWKKGMPLRRFLNSAQRHITQFPTGKHDEDHLTAAIWNLLCLGETQHEILWGRLPSALDDLFQTVSRSDITNAKPAHMTAGEVLKLAEEFNLPEKAFMQHATKPVGTSEGFTEIGDTRQTVTRDGRIGTETLLIRGAKGTEGPMPQDNQPEPFTVESDVEVVARRRRDNQPKPFTVYLCGPITGEQVDYDWRQSATAYFETKGIVTLDPLRGKHIDAITHQGLGYKGQLAAPEIADRDEDDIRRADLILAHFPYTPPRQSIGSLMEMGAAAIGFKRPVVLCTTEQVFKDHLFCRNFTTIFSEFRAALDFIVGKSRGK